LDLSSTAHIIGVVVSETTSDTGKIAN